VTGYVIGAYGVFVAVLGSYLAILLPRHRSKRRELAVLEDRLEATRP
jgi:heme exporter protein CcmD